MVNKVKINFITSESRERTSGGWSGLSFNIFSHLEARRELQINYVGPIYPPVSRLAKLVSKTCRVLGGKGRFFAFSEGRLQRVRRQVETARIPVDYDFFLGVTPWVRCRFAPPYGAYLDACFRTYFENNLPTREFSATDIRRIESAEKAWLEDARPIFWASAWSRDQAVRHYGLASGNHEVVGIGGNLEVPAADTYTSGAGFIFIAQNFALKGGPIACTALQTVRRKYPEATLTILGQEPPAEWLRLPGIHYAGYFRKSVPAELARFRALLAESFCLLHPTQSDMVPQVIIETAYFGAPAIAPKRFAIPELIRDRQTGVLVEAGFTAADFAREMLWLLDDAARYREIRRAARDHSTTRFTFASVTRKIVTCVAAATVERRS